MEDRMENLLHLAVSLVLNLILFTLLSFYLLVKVDVPSKPPLQVYVEDIQKTEEVKLIRGRQVAAQRPKGGEGTVKRGMEKVSASPMQVDREEGDVQVPKGIPTEEPSLLKDIEQKIRGKKKDIEEEGVKASELGDMVAVVSSSGIGLSGSGRRAIYIPPLPKVASDEPLSVLKIRIWVEPSGVVSKAQIVQRSGSPQVDQEMLSFVKGIRFEPIRDNVVQTGIISFRFKGG
ncbi:MAG: energy transducer TonB [Aquificaceae bacterium]